MGESTAIAWTDHTFNPWWGCARVSPGCQHCYAETFAKRTGHAVWGKDVGRRFFGDKHWGEPIAWNAKAQRDGVRRRVFCASMADVFEDRDELLPHRDRLFDLIEATPWLDWQLLTKRPENVDYFIPDSWEEGEGGAWPRNCWLGVTVEDQQRAHERIPLLAYLPAPVRFLSCEPLLSMVNLWPWLDVDEPTIDWVIAGGESGAGHRLLELDWARELRNQCSVAGVPFFFKQVGGRTPTAGGDLLDHVRHKDFPDVEGAATTT